MHVIPASTLPSCDKDTARWESVETGLLVLFTTWCAMPLVVASFLLLIASAREPIAVILLGMITLVSFGGVGFAIGRCCRVPAGIGAYPPLIATIALLVGAAALTVWCLTPVRFLAPTLIRWQARLPDLMIEGAIGGVLVFGNLAWLLFLRAIAIALDGEDLSRNLRNYALLLSFWIGSAVAAVWILFATGDNAASSILAIINFFALFSHYFCMMFLLEATRKLIAESVRASRDAETGNPG
jgi:hypothetical protein